MEDQEPAAARGPERAPEPPAHKDFDDREPAAPSDAAREPGYSEPPIPGSVADTSAPADRPREGGARGGYGGGYRDRGRPRGGRGRRPAPPPRRRPAGDFDRPPRADAPPRDPDFREGDAPRREDDYVEDRPARAYDEPEHDDAEPADVLPEGEGAPEAVTEEFPDDAAEARPPLREPDRERERPRDPRREPYARGGRPDRRGTDRGGERRDDRYDRGGRESESGRGLYRSIRSQIDRVRHSLESVLRDMERVVQMLHQAEHEHALGEHEIEKLREQLDDLQRGGGRSFDRRRHDDSH